MLNKNLMCYSYSSYSSGRMAELADAHALGACGVTHKSSTLFSPTRKATVLGHLMSKFVATHVALKKKCCSVKGVCIGIARFLDHWLDLGTTHQTYTYSLLHTFQQYQHVFFKINMYALVDSFCNKCNKYTKIRHFLMQHIHLCILNLIRNRTL